jgi:hypothetical protein
MALLLGSTNVPTTSPTRSASVEKRGEEKNVLGFPRGTGRLVLMCCDSRTTVHRRWTARSALGRLLAQVGEVIFGPGLHCDLWSSRGPGRTRIGLWAGFSV